MVPAAWRHRKDGVVASIGVRQREDPASEDLRITAGHLRVQIRPPPLSERSGYQSRKRQRPSTPIERPTHAVWNCGG
jgi:hypothetical protein